MRRRTFLVLWWFGVQQNLLDLMDVEMQPAPSFLLPFLEFVELEVFVKNGSSSPFTLGCVLVHFAIPFAVKCLEKWLFSDIKWRNGCFFYVKWRYVCFVMLKNRIVVLATWI